MLNGKEVANQIQLEISEKVDILIKKGNPRPVLAAILVGENSASKIYIKKKRKMCEKLGIYSQYHNLEENTTELEVN